MLAKLHSRTKPPWYPTRSVNVVDSPSGNYVPRRVPGSISPRHLHTCRTRSVTTDRVPAEGGRVPTGRRPKLLCDVFDAISNTDQTTHPEAYTLTRPPWPGPVVKALGHGIVSVRMVCMYTRGVTKKLHLGKQKCVLGILTDIQQLDYLPSPNAL